MHCWQAEAGRNVADLVEILGQDALEETTHELVKLGTSPRPAISIGLSRKGSYRLAKTLAAQPGMTNKWLKDQVLLSVKDLWVRIHYPATAR
ncbi:MAG: hypothetical protein R6T90_03545 [Dissulfuribacterales bacterium]